MDKIQKLEFMISTRQPAFPSESAQATTNITDVQLAIKINQIIEVVNELVKDRNNDSTR